VITANRSITLTLDDPLCDACLRLATPLRADAAFAPANERAVNPLRALVRLAVDETEFECDKRGSAQERWASRAAQRTIEAAASGPR